MERRQPTGYNNMLSLSEVVHTVILLGCRQLDEVAYMENEISLHNPPAAFASFGNYEPPRL